ARTAALALPGVDAARDARLREVHFGEFDGQNVEKNRLHPLFQEWAETPWSTPAPGGESFADVARRGLAWLSELPEDANVLAFSHSVFVRSLVCVLLGLKVEARDGWTFPFPLSLAHASLTRLARHRGEWALEVFSDTAHLEPWAAGLLDV
ncbi:histidine phosphatase family protein, partial [Deinococcus pimensis]|uniref:histidine phosphatase family protein n=1 Tax=Deinococcus pimensis TaxID=309888 RepID=UPI0006938A67